jgi:hypothetical protein
MPTTMGHDDEMLLFEMRALKPRVERLLDAIEQQAAEKGRRDAQQEQTAIEVKQLLGLVRDGNGKASLVVSVNELLAWKKQQIHAEIEREKEKRNNRVMTIFNIIGWIIVIAIAIYSKGAK